MIKSKNLHISNHLYTFYIFIIFSLSQLVGCANLNKEKVSLENLIPEESSFINTVSEGFERLTMTRGVYVSYDYKNISKAISEGLKCFTISATGNNISHISNSIIHASKTSKLTISYARNKKHIKRNCHRLRHTIIAINTDSKNEKPFQMLRIRGVDPYTNITFSFDKNEEWLFAIFSEPGSKIYENLYKQLVEKRDVNYLSKYNILINELKAKSIRGIEYSNEERNGTPLWIRQKKTNNPIVSRKLSTLEFLQSTLDEKVALLILNWRNDQIASQLIGKHFVSKENLSSNKKHIIDIKNNIADILNIKNLVAQRAPTRLRGIDLNKETYKKINLSSENVWKTLGNALLHKKLSPYLTNIKKLIIIAPGEISTLPFSAIINPITGNHLIDDYSISLLPDLVSLTIKNKQWLPDKKINSLVIGDPLTPKNVKDYSFPPLPGARNEARIVANIWNTKPYIGENASVKVIDKMIEKASLVHIAAHGIADSEKPLRNSFIAMSGKNEKDSRFTGMKILNNDLSMVRLAIMSACQSGLGFQHKQGTIGLARAFYIAGTPRVIMSLWNVDDTATEFLMTNFHKSLKHTMPAQALRHAIIKTRKRYPEPSKWASFMMFGSQ